MAAPCPRPRGRNRSGPRSRHLLHASGRTARLDGDTRSNTARAAPDRSTVRLASPVPPHRDGRGPSRPARGCRHSTWQVEHPSPRPALGAA
jgi:hypothetical protein